MTTNRKCTLTTCGLTLLAGGLLLVGCGKKTTNGSQKAGGGNSVEIQNAGSDTMVNIAQAWAEAYGEANSTVDISVAGGGSGTGIAALINGTTDIANCSRAMKNIEKKKAKNTHGKDPQQYIMGLDALAVYVHKDNPLNEITIEQLGQIYGEDGRITKWSQLGIKPNDGHDEIIRISRQSNSGTYVYFKETVVPKGKEFKLGSRDLHGSKDVVEIIGNTPSAIGYSGMGYATDHVKMLKVSSKQGQVAYTPNIENVVNKTYPISRPLYMYTLGVPTSRVKTYIDWCLSDAGQKIIIDNGFIPAPKN